MWAEHADAIATAYGGSAALKSDFTRTGKRTRKGLLEDGVKSTMRYIKNNFFDGARQVCVTMARLTSIKCEFGEIYALRMDSTWSLDSGWLKGHRRRRCS